MCKKRDQKYEIECLKSREEFNNRLMESNWKDNPNRDYEFRLAALICFIPGKSIRKIYNLAKINTGV